MSQRHIAEVLARRLEAYVTPVPWWTAFPRGQTTLASLMAQAEETDLAVFLFSRDDLRHKSGAAAGPDWVVRDNVLFELGLFAGALGAERSIMLVDSANVPAIPTDLSGVTYMPYDATAPDGIHRLALGIRDDARRLFDERGLGWWSTYLRNESDPARRFYGLFRLDLAGRSLCARFGETRYASTFPPDLAHRPRSHWNSSRVLAFGKRSEPKRFLITADVTSAASPTDPSPDAYRSLRHQTVFNLQETGRGGIYTGAYFDIDGLLWRGHAEAARLGDCTEEQAREEAIRRFFEY